MNIQNDSERVGAMSDIREELVAAGIIQQSDSILTPVRRDGAVLELDAMGRLWAAREIAEGRTRWRQHPSGATQQWRDRGAA